MKSLLLLCLLAAISCNLSKVSEVASCLVKNEIAANAIVDIFEAIKLKKYTLIPKLLTNDYAELQKVTSECLNELDDVSLQNSWDLKICLKGCLPGNLLCINACYSRHGK